MSESKDGFRKENENLNSISEPENKLSRDTPVLIKFSCFGHCPRCGNFVGGPEDNFCSKCGQALLWPSFSKTKEKAEEDLPEEGETGKPDLTTEAAKKDEQDSVKQAQDDPNDDGSFLEIAN